MAEDTKDMKTSMSEQDKGLSEQAAEQFYKGMSL